jgi:histidine triad (HIT) family protein
MTSAPGPPCTFCEIIAGRLPSSVAYQDDQIFAFMDINPVNPGHVLVIPKEHYASLAELPEAIAANLFTVAQRLSAAIRRSGVRCEGIRMHLADGAAAGQDVFHCHLHVYPRFIGDGYAVAVSDQWQPPSREMLDSVAERICSAYAASDHGP